MRQGQRTGLRAIAAALALVLGLATQAAAQSSYASRPIRLISPFGAGGSSDLMARLIAGPLGEALGQPVYVENRPGAGSNLGTATVARAEADGHTFLITTSSFVINPSVYQSVPFDPIKDFAPVADLADAPNLLVANPKAKIANFADLLARAKAQPESLNCGTAGYGATTHLSLELLKARAGVTIAHVPFQGGGPALQAVLANTTQLFFSAMPNVQGHVKSGTLTPMAVTSRERWPDLPDVPTFIESGFPDFVVDTFHVMLAPAGTPPEILKRVSKETLAIMQRPEIRQRLRTAGFRVIAGGPDGLRVRIAREVAFYRDIVQRAKLKIE